MKSLTIWLSGHVFLFTITSTTTREQFVETFMERVAECQLLDKFRFEDILDYWYQLQSYGK